jgi:hypothetical protein
MMQVPATHGQDIGAGLEVQPRRFVLAAHHVLQKEAPHCGASFIAIRIGA